MKLISSDREKHAPRCRDLTTMPKKTSDEKRNLCKQTIRGKKNYEVPSGPGVSVPFKVNPLTLSI